MEGKVEASDSGAKDEEFLLDVPRRGNLPRDMTRIGLGKTPSSWPPDGHIDFQG